MDKLPVKLYLLGCQISAPRVGGDEHMSEGIAWVTERHILGAILWKINRDEMRGVAIKLKTNINYSQTSQFLT